MAPPSGEHQGSPLSAMGAAGTRGGPQRDHQGRPNSPPEAAEARDAPSSGAPSLGDGGGLDDGGGGGGGGLGELDVAVHACGALREFFLK